MNFYTLCRPLLLSLPPEFSHTLSLKLLKLSYALTKHLSGISNNQTSIKVMGIDFPNRVGLAAGLDKNADYIDALGALGFGFVEVGTVTPVAQPGNPKPRLFRLTQQQAIINAMGFNNKGVDYLCEQVKKSHFKGIIGINIGKNALTPIENAVDDYLIGLKKAYPFANYLTVNISSPNTNNLRSLQYKDQLEQLLQALKNEQEKLAVEYGHYVPIALKIAPDLTQDEIRQIAELLLQYKFDGVIATNTTLSRAGVEHSKWAKQNGGLSGAPLTQLSTQVIKILKESLQGKIPIIAVGGIMSVQDAQEKIVAGADLIQIYTGLIYRGPKLVKELVRYFNKS